jgi:exopolyphosphatase/guanosine-5'-triphosphate,3'-diphosphate pyrophosphatase
MAMRVGVVDVGSNTVRLLVADVNTSELAVVHEGRAWVRLGADVAQTGEISADRLDAVSEAVTTFATDARRVGCAQLDVLVASPGRQALNAGELVRRLERASPARVRVLGREEEARLGFHGALCEARPLEGAVAVCDVGGGSTQLAIGLFDEGPVWMRSFDVGSLLVTAESFGGDRPDKKAIATARHRIRAQFDGLAAPLPAAALAVGGSARAVRRLVGRTLGEEELREAVSILRRHSSKEIGRKFDVRRDRARTLLAGALILTEVQHRLMVPLRVVTTGVREGAVLDLAREQSLAA